MAIPYSVVIPSHNRGEVLFEVLAALDAQQGAPDFEVIVVDDGSSDGTAERLKALRADRHVSVHLEPARGPAAARNLGVRRSRGERVAFLGDDTVPRPDWLAAHAERAANAALDQPLAVVGYTDWHPRIRVTRFLRYLNEQGPQFGYALIEDPDDVPFNFFYTSNLSLRRELLLAEPFDEEFPYPAWEDIETAYRLRRRGLRIVYAPDAKVEHDHPTDFARFALRQERAGFAGVVFHERHPELGAFLGLGPEGPGPLPGRLAQSLAEALVRALQNAPVNMPRLWEKTLRYHYAAGLHRGWRERGRHRGGGS